MTDSHDRFRQLPQPLFAHFIQTYLTDVSAFALIATDKETFHRYRHWYIMKSECTWLCMHHRSGDDPVNEWMFIHLRQPREDVQLLTDSIKEATDGKNDRWEKLPDEPEPTPFTQLPQLKSNFSHPLSIGIMNPSRIKLREDSLQANVDLAAFKLPPNLKCFPSPLPHTIKHLYLTPTTGSHEGRSGISITFYSQWSEFVLPPRLEVLEFLQARPTYFTKEMNWPSTLHTMVIKACSQNFIAPERHTICLPATLTDLAVSFDTGNSADKGGLEHVQLPSELKRLEFLSANSSPTGWNLPSTLLELVLGDDFNEPIIDWILPPNLTRLQFGNKFNQSLVGVKWPDSLTEIFIAGEYRQSLVDVTFPLNLTRLTIVTRQKATVASGSDLTGVVFPSSLQSLTLSHLGTMSGLPRHPGLAVLRLPTCRWTVEYPVMRAVDLTQLHLPSTLHTLQFDHSFRQVAALMNLHLLVQLRVLWLGQADLTDLTLLPPYLEEFEWCVHEALTEKGHIDERYHWSNEWPAKSRDFEKWDVIFTGMDRLMCINYPGSLRRLCVPDVHLIQKNFSSVPWKERWSHLNPVPPLPPFLSSTAAAQTWSDSYASWLEQFYRTHPRIILRHFELANAFTHGDLDQFWH